MRSERMEDHILYFAFGSNLLAERLAAGSCSSITYPNSLHGIAKLNNWELFFARDSKNWKGSTASIQQKEGSVVWGALWRIKANELPLLDKQEGVSLKKYSRLKSPDDLKIVDSEGNVVQCYTYIMNDQMKPGNPSPHYKHVIISGAKQIGLPKDYIDKLEEIETNGYNGKVGVDVSVLPNGQLPF